ncbi:MAG: hypothetical protein J5563_04550 [Clostridia bacterium]|nr:hypothetical protein [Clostridia bacterium]
MEIRNIFVSDVFSIDFSSDKTEYTVLIPDGRPSVPSVSVEGDGNWRVFQAFIPDSGKSGKATVIAGDKTYYINFVKDISRGFVLQYDDRYSFVPDYKAEDGENIEYFSTDSGVLSVDEYGTVVAKALSDRPVTVTASLDGTVIDSLTVDKVIKAPLNIFLIIGQSNAYGYHDVPEGTDKETYFAGQKSLCDCPAPGTVYCDDIGNSYDDVFYSGWYDLSSGRNGFSPSLGKEWYRLTGEKTLMLQTALGSMPIEAWTPDGDLKCFGIDCYWETVGKFTSYRSELEKPESCYTLNHVFAFWLQGETCEEYLYSPETFYWNKNGMADYAYVGDWYNVNDPRVPKGLKLITADEYYTLFLDMYRGFENSIGLEYMAILPVRSMMSVSSGQNRKSEQLTDLVPPRIAQFALNYSGSGNIGIVTLETEIGRTDTYSDIGASGWGYLGCNNIHYDQIGYNALGRDSAYNLFKKMTESSVCDPKDIRIMDYDGTTLDADSTVKVFLFETRQISAIVLPLYSEGKVLSFESLDTGVCTIDRYGLIKASPEAKLGDTALVVVSNGVISKSINVIIG